MVLLVPKDELLRAVSEQSERLMHCARYCNEERRFLKGCAQRAAGQSCRGRLLAYLVEQSDDMGMLNLQVSKAQLAESLGIAYASLLKELDELQSERQIAMAGASVLLINKDALTKQLNI